MSKFRLVTFVFGALVLVTLFGHVYAEDSKTSSTTSTTAKVDTSTDKLTEAQKQQAEADKKAAAIKTEASKKNTELNTELVKKRDELTKKKSEAEAELAKKKTEVEQHKSDRAADAAKNCDQIQTHISTVTSKYESNKGRNVTAYKNMRTRLSTFITRFNAKGLDTTQLSTDLATLDVKLAQLDTDYAAYMTALLGTKQYVCGKSEGEFKSTLEGARKEMVVVKADITDIQTFYQTTIKTDLTALRAQVEASEKASSSTTSSGATVPTTTSSTSSTVTQ